jgi:hypothetical protein
MTTFAEKQQAERPRRWPTMEFVFKGKARCDWDSQLINSHWLLCCNVPQ